MKNNCALKCSGYYRVEDIDIENHIFPIEIRERLIDLGYTKNLKHCYYCSSVWVEDEKDTKRFKIIMTKNLSTGEIIWHI